MTHPLFQSIIDNHLNIARAQTNYDRDNGEQSCKVDETEFSLDDMPKDKYAMRLAKMEAVKQEVIKNLNLAARENFALAEKK